MADKKTASEKAKGFIGCSVLFLIAVVILISILPDGEEDSEVPTTNSMQPTPIKQKEKIVISGTVVASQLVEEYNNNEVAADSKYKNKYFRINGIATSITETFGDVQVAIEGDGYFNTVDCTMLDSERQKAMSLSKGNTVSIEGRIKGMLIGSVNVDKCRFIVP